MCSRRPGAGQGHEAGTAAEAAGREADGSGATHLHRVDDDRDEVEPRGRLDTPGAVETRHTRGRHAPKLHVLPALHYGESDDPWKMTYSRMAVSSRPCSSFSSQQNAYRKQRPFTFQNRHPRSRGVAPARAAAAYRIAYTIGSIPAGFRSNSENTLHTCIQTDANNLNMRAESAAHTEICQT